MWQEEGGRGSVSGNPGCSAPAQALPSSLSWPPLDKLSRSSTEPSGGLRHSCGHRKDLGALAPRGPLNFFSGTQGTQTTRQEFLWVPAENATSRDFPVTTWALPQVIDVEHPVWPQNPPSGTQARGRPEVESNTTVYSFRACAGAAHGLWKMAREPGIGQGFPEAELGVWGEGRSSHPSSRVLLWCFLIFE